MIKKEAPIPYTLNLYDTIIFLAIIIAAISGGYRGFVRSTLHYVMDLGALALYFVIYLLVYQDPYGFKYVYMPILNIVLLGLFAFFHSKMHAKIIKIKFSPDWEAAGDRIFGVVFGAFFGFLFGLAFDLVTLLNPPSVEQWLLANEHSVMKPYMEKGKNIIIVYLPEEFYAKLKAGRNAIIEQRENYPTTKK